MSISLGLNLKLASIFRNILRSIAISVPLVIVLYVSMNISYMIALTVPEMTSAPAVAVLFGERVLGPFKFLIPMGVAFATLGCALSLQFSVTRYVQICTLLQYVVVILCGFKSN